MIHLLGREAPSFVRSSAIWHWTASAAGASSIDTETARTAGNLDIDGVSIGAGASAQPTIDLPNALVFLMGLGLDGASAKNATATGVPGFDGIYIKVVDAHTLEADSEGPALSAGYGPIEAWANVIEFYPGVIENVQRGTASFTGTTYASTVSFARPIAKGRLGMSLLGRFGGRDYQGQSVVHIEPVWDSNKLAATGLTIATNLTSGAPVSTATISWQAWQWASAGR